MTAIRQRPWYYLTRHFFGGLFDLGFLSEAGADSFTRMILGCCVVFFSFGLLLTRIFAATHTRFQSPEAFRLALLANHTFLIAVPMWIVAFVTVLLGHSLFPDETDFRVLMALPLPRRLIFGAKLSALALFVGLFVVAAHVALLPLSLLMSTGMFVGAPWPAQFAAYLVSSLLASAFAAMAVVAVQGLLVLTAPRGRPAAVSTGLRSAMLCILVIGLPFVLRFPGRSPDFAVGSTWLYFAPPVWFLGVERWLLGDASRAYVPSLIAIAAAAVALAGAVAAGSYAMLYRRFDRVMLRPAQEDGGSAPRLAWRGWRPRPGSRPIFAAIRGFTSITLRRSVLHQGIVVALSAGGAGLVVNSLLAVDLAGWLGSGRRAGGALTAAVLWAPFVLMFVASFAVRMALMIPIEPRANWIFRITEHDAARVDQLDAAVHIVRRFGVIVPVVLTAPIQWLVLGRGAVGAVAVTLLCGWLLVEILMTGWARIPCACGYMPGKGFVPQRVLTRFSSFVFFTTVGAGLAGLGAAGRPGSFVFATVLLGVVVVLRRRRRRAWIDAPLAFEDHLPTEVNPLRLSPE